MKISLKWLGDYTHLTLPPRELAERLTMAGMEVKGTQITGGSWQNIVIGKIIAIKQHPNADRLKLVTVDLGKRQLTVVCGAPNLKAGDKAPFANVGAQLIDAHTGKTVPLRPTKIRGVASEGVLCSEKELGVSDSHEGIMILSEEAPVGIRLVDYLGDVILDLEVTPNRPDCLSIIGIAREVAALNEQPLHLPKVHYDEPENPIDSFLSVKIDAPVLCPRYCASLITGVKVALSPQWLQQRLSACDMRPINNIVDVTNYVMLEYGQPLHAFDYHKIAARQIIVRRASESEVIATLDGVERALNQDMLVIADKERAIAVAGIMGGLDTEVTPETNTILIESANFNQAAIRQACNRLNLRSEASLRFEKGLSPDLPPEALRRATQLITELTGGDAAKGIIDVYPKRLDRNPILLSTNQMKRLLGMEVKLADVIKTLELLGFECEKTDLASQVSVAVPCWRSDISCSADLVEEVARLIGYDKVPTTMLSAPLPMYESSPKLEFREKIRDILVSCGFQEVLTYSLTNLEMLKKLSPELHSPTPTPLRVANPMTWEQEHLRTTLRANILATLSRNQKYGEASLKIFEIGKVFLPRDKDLPEEKEMLCAVINGAWLELSWRGNRKHADFFNAKGIAESLLKQLRLEASFKMDEDESLHPGKRANIVINGQKVGVIGELHPGVSQSFELSGITCLIEIDIEKLLPLVTKFKKYQPIPRFPSITRDIALVVNEQVTYQQVCGIIQNSPLVSQVTLFDIYSGEQVPLGKKSFAFRLIYQSPSHTLTDEEVNQTQQQILDELHHKLDASLRS